MIKKLSFFISIILFGSAFGQKDKEVLQKQNADLKKQISSLNATLNQTKQESKLSISYLNAVNQKLSLREKVYRNTQKQKRFIEDDIYKRQLEINKNNRELEVLRKNYAEILVKAYKTKGVQNKVTFILSSKNMGEALNRIEYLKRYSEYQDKKAAEISNKANEIKKNITLKKRSVSEKDNLLLSQKKDLATIEAERIEKQKLLDDFKKNEVKLTAELRQKQTQSKELERQIRNIIAEEIRIAKAKEEAERKAEAERKRLADIAAKKEKDRIEAENRAKIAAAEAERKRAELEAKRATELAAKRAEEERKLAETNKAIERKEAAERATKEAADRAKIANERAAAAKANEVAVNKKNDDAKDEVEKKVMKSYGVGSTVGNNFADNKGRIGFPVEKGTVTHRFGRQPHPVFKNIVEENIGIKISVAKGTKARCVFPGVVSSIQAINGSRTVVVKHGNYFTVYSNLASTLVKANQQVSAGTLIGEVGSDFDESITLDFQIWSGTNPVDPLGWVSY
ncbi:peptidoglycan DD-metalloendopeptidase family protein [Epilithonimonas ginsengisoli]|uniref:Peptidoglycan DD-metalloendopeptidase family protein n=1 Tax=Epilithonimonas ginsengisoli TaxID=1245592 RepID=A0ABU4JCS0_9FLAO|nr:MULTISPECIES: peptidoglycan DD-metalloendopeptidase family protein [Chryseobacterium group]MBV6878294.1 peptidoglycan DD-metalloendopeptidase family protein [Epilithonimonas sp. FP105]MDW8547463.1 peptidoglycan DD-metalloendopeptidase family protein [Epilithonimonas ginsengisoli]OAH68945.1 peptidase M23 [Chryseobacterium sp. FP211-J200]